MRMADRRERFSGAVRYRKNPSGNGQFRTLILVAGRLKVLLLTCVRHCDSALNRRYAEVSGKMKQVKWTDGAGNGYEIDLVSPDGQYCDFSDGSVVEPKPQIGFVRAVLFSVPSSQMLPARSVILRFHRVQNTRIVSDPVLKAVAVD